jgi:hypothetical protein
MCAIDERGRGDRLFVDDCEENGPCRDPRAVKHGGHIGGRCDPKQDVATRLGGARGFMGTRRPGPETVIHPCSREMRL